MKIRLLSIALVGVASSVAIAAPLKVFILAGQSNMQGQVNISTIDYMAKDPKTAPLRQAMLDSSGKPKVVDNVWISFLSEDRNMKGTLKEGPLTSGFAARPDCIGPEFTFGLTMQQSLKQPILLIKTAWGGKNLSKDFRPPSASGDGAGTYYKLMIEHVNKVLQHPEKLVQGYKASDGYELAGFVWFQGWNDLVDKGVYPKRDQPGGYDLYTEYLGHLIRDVRKDLNAPKMPVVIGVLGVGGPVENISRRFQAINRNFRAAMAAPAELPEFKGNVFLVRTEEFWDKGIDSIGGKKKEEMTPEQLEIQKGTSNQQFHYCGAAKIIAPIGKAFADALLTH